MYIFFSSSLKKKKKYTRAREAEWICNNIKSEVYNSLFLVKISFPFRVSFRIHVAFAFHGLRRDAHSAGGRETDFFLAGRFFQDIQRTSLCFALPSPPPSRFPLPFTRLPFCVCARACVCKCALMLFHRFTVGNGPSVDFSFHTVLKRRGWPL